MFIFIHLMSILYCLMLYTCLCMFRVLIFAFYVFKYVYTFSICLSALMRAIDMHLIKDNLLTYLLTYMRHPQLT